MSNDKKITVATVKAFIRKAVNTQSLFFKEISKFDSMTDGVVKNPESQFDSYEDITEVSTDKYTLGIPGVWFVQSSGNSCSRYEDSKFEGFKVYNCCGSWIVAKKK
jgi:hypothetical protein